MNELIYHFFTDDDFLRISNKIKEAEKTTSGEIRVSIKEEVPFLKRKKSIKELAEEEFYKLNMDKTRDKTGILLFIVLGERKFYILADEGINEKVSPDTWGRIRSLIENEFRNGRFTQGIIAGIEEIGKVLSQHFPIKPDDTNELSNKVVI